MGRFLNNKELKSPGHALTLTQSPSSLRPRAPVIGQIRFNTDTNLIEAYYNSVWNSLSRIGRVNVTKDTYTGNNSTVTYTMTQSYTAGDEAKIIVVVGNIFQNPGTAFTVSGTQITFTSPPPLGQTVIVLHGYASTNATA